MERIVFTVPKMYADHHVVAVREALLGLKGVEDVMASSAFKRVVVGYDPSALDPKAIEERLRATGYGPSEDWEISTPPEGKEDDSPWFKLTQRVTQTNMLDIQMSGDFRKY